MARKAGRFGFRSVLAALLLHTATGVAQNLAQNPGFETGNTSGWFAFGSPTIAAQSAQVRSGNYAALVSNRSEPWHGIAQSFLGVFQPGQTYDFSVWVRLVSGGSQNIHITVKRADGSGDNYSYVGGGSVSSTGWTQLSGSYTLNPAGPMTELTMYLEVPGSATAAFYVDDLFVSLDGGGVEGASTVMWDTVHQRIDGFGASSAWRGHWTTWQANMLFSTNSGTGTSRNGTNFAFNGVGLSLLRSRIVPGGTTVEQSIMQMAQARGARVWSAPWSPAAQFKSNTNVNGGSFVGTPANYEAYANQLAGYVLNMKNQFGVDLYALSVQNEPDANVTTYESCNWTSTQIRDFMPYLHGALAASNVGGTKIMLPESQNWTDPQGLRLATMNNPVTAAMVGIIANHNYVPNNDIGDQNPPAAINNYGKALWQTEVAKLSGNDSSIQDGLYWAGRVHQFMTIAQVNAWHYWWLFAYGNSNEGLCDTNDVPAKRMYTLGNFSRFVRPGFHRIGISGTGNAQVSAYRSLTNDAFAIVAINATGTAINQTFTLNGFNAGTVTPWITSAGLSLVPQTAVSVNEGAFTYALPSESVVTFTGQALPANTAPSLALIPDQTVNAGVTLVLTNSATDPDVPPQMLTFSLLGGPEGADLDPASGVFTWRPPVSQAGSTNQVTVRVTDDGVPALSDTNSFSIVVNPLEPTVIESITKEGGEILLGVNGPVGPDYLVWSATNLMNWELLFTTNPPALPVMLTLTNNGPQGFYRLELGP